MAQTSDGWNRLRWAAFQTFAPLFLFLLNGVLIWRLFKTEYLDEMGSIEGAYVALARYIRFHGLHLGWWPYWFCGMPFRNTYPPGLHSLAAAVSRIADLSAARALHVVEAVGYALGPVTLYWLIHRLTRSALPAFCAGLLYSLTSASAFLLAPIRQDLGSAFGAQRMHALVHYGDGPHVFSLTLIPVAILALHWSCERKTIGSFFVCAIAFASLPLTNWPGTLVLVAATGAYILAYHPPGSPDWAAQWLRLFAAVAYSYGLACCWIPPSNIALILRNTQSMDPRYRFSPHHLLYLAIVLAAILLELIAFHKWKTDHALRFALLFLTPIAAVVLGSYWLGIVMLAQPHRFHLAMEMALVMTLVLAARPLMKRRALSVASAALLAGVCLSQVVAYYRYEKRLIRSVDIRRTSEYKIAAWFAGHRGGRVMVPGSISFWLNAFADTPQLTGCCDQAVGARVVEHAEYVIQGDHGAGNRAYEVSLAWLQALGVQQVAVSGPRSTEFYHADEHPWKFDGR